jgi:RNA polymerase sigma-70 factor (ECF subfamily)
MTTPAHVLQQARGGDEAAFAELVTPYRRELHVHCYRMLGSFDDAEDALQDTLLAAWRGIGGFRAEASVRTWLYRLATNTCLNHRRTTSRRPQAATAPPPETGPPPNGMDAVTWLQAYPDALLDALPEPGPGPETRIETRESISLAFVAAVQALSPRSRAVLVLRDVMGFSGGDVATMLGTSSDAVATQLRRSRTTLRSQDQTGHTRGRPTPDEYALARRFADALTARDVDAIVDVLTEDIRVAMPPLPYRWTGLTVAVPFLTDVAFRPDVQVRATLTAANRQPALAVYSRREDTEPWLATGLLVLTVRDGRIAALTRFEPDGRFPPDGETAPEDR